MGKDFSKNLGVPYNFILFMGITIAAMITASVIVVVGSVSYIGLIVPKHCCDVQRRQDPRYFDRYGSFRSVIRVGVRYDRESCDYAVRVAD